MAEIKVQTHVRRALESGNRVDANKAKMILDNILKDGVSPTELKDAEAIAVSAARTARLTSWDGLGALGRDKQLRAEGKDDEADRMLGRVTTAMKNTTELKLLAQKLYQDLDAAYQKQGMKGKVIHFFSQTWDATWK